MKKEEATIEKLMDELEKSMDVSPREGIKKGKILIREFNRNQDAIEELGDKICHLLNAENGIPLNVLTGALLAVLVQNCAMRPFKTKKEAEEMIFALTYIISNSYDTFSSALGTASKGPSAKSFVSTEVGHA